MPPPWKVYYLRPDGWWLAGSGFKSRSHAEECAKEQLPAHVRWVAATRKPKRGWSPAT